MSEGAQRPFRYAGCYACITDCEVDITSAFLRTFAERELLALGMDAEAYELRFDSTIAQHAPTFLFLLIPAIAGVTKALLPKR